MTVSSSYIRIAATEPEAALDAALEVFAAGDAAAQWLLVDFDFREYWCDGEPVVALLAIYHLQRRAHGIEIEAAVVERAAALTRLLPTAADALEAWLDALDIPRFALHRPLQLAPIAIPKPWGQEIWYTGIERRGVAGVAQGGAEVLLPRLLALAPRRLCGRAERKLILLKILDPLADVVFGDLYFELHREKQEVYVVTEVDRGAWPDGTGAIRFGFDAGLRRRYADDAAFLADYLASVRAYREVRRDIDALLDDLRTLEGVGLNDPVPADTLRRWLAAVPVALQEREHECRTAMDAFTGLLPLRVGDVIKVPCWVPHSLQHGVRTVEFQTPVYERLILSFAQKVLTQAQWDTDTAAELLQMDPPPPLPWEVTGRGEGWVEERIVEFDDFEVRRVTLQPGSRRQLPAPSSYALCMVVGGQLQLDAATLQPDQALLLPGSWGGGSIHNPGSAPHIFLLATPLAQAQIPSG